MGLKCESHGPDHFTDPETTVREICDDDDTCAGYDYKLNEQHGHTCSQVTSKTDSKYKICERNGNTTGECHYVSFTNIKRLSVCFIVTYCSDMGKIRKKIR